jgi:hypothetical protein
LAEKNKQWIKVLLTHKCTFMTIGAFTSNWYQKVLSATIIYLGGVMKCLILLNRTRITTYLKIGLGTSRNQRILAQNMSKEDRQEVDCTLQHRESLWRNAGSSLTAWQTFKATHSGVRLDTVDCTPSSLFWKLVGLPTAIMEWHDPTATSITLV